MDKEQSKERIYKGRVVELNLEAAALPDGRVSRFEIVRHPGGAVIVALDKEQRVCLIRQYRHAVGAWIWELPAGLLESDEEPEISARRELKEEAGATASTWKYLGSLLSSPGFCDERLHLFLATDLVIGEPEHEKDEFIEVHWLPLEQALEMANGQVIEDSKSVVGLFRAMVQLD